MTLNEWKKKLRAWLFIMVSYRLGLMGCCTGLGARVLISKGFERLKCAIMGSRMRLKLEYG